MRRYMTCSGLYIIARIESQTRTEVKLIFNYKPIAKEYSALTREIKEFNDQFGVEFENKDVSELLRQNQEVLSKQVNKKNVKMQGN